MTNQKNLKKCPGCGGKFPDTDGPTHRYLESTPGCWAAYGDVLAREYSDPDYFSVHQLTVNTYSIQHPGEPSRLTTQSVVVHLIGLYAELKEHLHPHQVSKLMDGATKRITFEWLNPPENRGNLTVADVLKAQSADEHKELVSRWAREAWRAWSDHHEQVKKWYIDLFNSG